MSAINRIPHNRIRFSPDYRYAVSLLQRKLSGTNRYRDALRTFRHEYACRTAEARAEYAEAQVAALARETRR